ncbi:site-specific integrase [Quadrisphaera sp. INWT6]|uniref:site-specific integrase n=1 Tax=Quadrisphaera sp. INWT6 TaxID=2596917 RepID=UPI00189213F7|nr:site-specific integrase [Quadrisphaera sp. INWT6]MBF5082332.1 site-specific integrase [Quadrisphaera sp. INWT6]
MGSIDRRPDGKYRARYRGPDRKQRTKQFARRADAQRWLAQVETTVAQGSWNDPALSRITVGEWAQRWLEGQVQLKPSTRHRYGILLRNQVLPAWAGVTLDRVTHADVSSWVASLSAAPLAPSTVRQAHRVLSRVLQHAVKDGRVPRNVAEGVPLPRLGRPQSRFLTLEEVERLATAAERIGDGGDLVRLLALTGLRFGEAVALRVGRVDLQRRRLSVVQSVTEVNGILEWGLPKNHQVRSVPIAQSLIEPLGRRCQGRTFDALLFTSPQGQPIRIQNWSKRVFAPATVEAGLRGVTPHDLRDTAASLAVAAGANVKAIQRMLGHASAAMTLDVYAGLFDDDLDALADRIDGLGTPLSSVHAPQTPPTGRHVPGLRR